ncbi:Unsaturated rhamnogalacturonyl hydrolase YteR [Pontiella desulfatans]|uniref:Unsaturated rhamnogalacturonyl hydrolase YteR n=1 Tax=Pontiella desulfatans TaxID=2750659 RepID=A0A6C2TYJ2_PONDE|nr:glycoside hydrolase family 88 protein [Pontiella desulfatans]VGO12524.1 Unsaturated rhamnogalacturonyl hydrolase YteR [Pontiella desulfatans]
MLTLALFPGVGLLAQAVPARPTVKQVKADMKRVADWQIGHFADEFRIRRGKKPPRGLGDWTNGALYVGMVKWAEIAGDDAYYGWLKKLSERQQWKLPQRVYHADDHCVGQLYLELYRKYGEAHMIAPTQAQLDRIMAATPTRDLKWKHVVSQDRWSWCDALFMAPPLWAKMSAVADDPKYRDWMFHEFQATTDYLFDKEEQLYFRDSRFFDQRHDGNKVFWARGNGWVFGGLALILPEIPKPSEQYDYFVGIYKQMAEKLVSIQTPEGYWPMSLLEADAYPTPETSGTGFNCFGLAWGINNGVLDRATYEPAVLKAWSALTRCITEEGMLGYVQPIGAAPGQAWPDKTEVYGAGAFLAAGAELVHLLEK